MICLSCDGLEWWVCICGYLLVFCFFFCGLGDWVGEDVDVIIFGNSYDGVFGVGMFIYVSVSVVYFFFVIYCVY